LGADRRGPLAAFIIVAVIAAIVLVTSVRSQAAPWWNPARLSATVAGPVLEPHLWGSVSGSMDDDVQAGAVLVRKTSGDSRVPTRTTQTPDTSGTIRPEHARATNPTQQHVPARRHHHRRRPHGPANGLPDAPVRPADPPAQATTPPTTPPTTPTVPTGRHDHGRHLGWLKHHHQADPPAPAGPDGPPTTDSADPGHGNGPGHAHGHQHSHAHGHQHGHAHGHDKPH
jgi:hypothetical protein